MPEGEEPEKGRYQGRKELEKAWRKGVEEKVDGRRRGEKKMGVGIGKGWG